VCVCAQCFGKGGVALLSAMQLGVQHCCVCVCVTLLCVCVCVFVCVCACVLLLSIAVVAVWTREHSIR